MTSVADALTQEELELLDAYWRAANYLSVGQIYLLDNPLLREPLQPEHVKPRLLGHFGTVPGLNLVYAHLNRAIRARDLDAIFVTGPGHGGPANVANAYLEGTYSELYPNVGEGEDGLRELFRQFSYPGGIPSHAAPETPGSIHEGGELGYALVHAFGAAFDNPDLVVACVVGDGEAETGPLAASWHSNKFLNPRRDGAVLPILHLNGWKIANPTVLARIPESELAGVVRGLRLGADLRLGRLRRREVAGGARTLRGRARPLARRNRADPGGGAAGRRARAAALADARAQDAERLDGAARGRRRPDRGHVALAPGASRGRPGKRGPAPPARGLDAQLPARGALRRGGPAAAGAGCSGPCRRSPDERQPARERRPPAARSRPARFPRLRGRGREAGDDVQRGDARARRLPPRRHRAATGRTSASSGRTRPLRTASAMSSPSRIAPGSRRRMPLDEHLSPTAG